MKFHWLRCWKNQEHSRHLWEPGTKNKGNCGTKHYAELHHQSIRPEFLTPKCQLELLRKRAERKKIRSKGVLERKPDRNDCQIDQRIARQDWQPKNKWREYPKSCLTHKRGEIWVCTYTGGGSTGKYINIRCKQSLIWRLEQMVETAVIALISLLWT